MTKIEKIESIFKLGIMDRKKICLVEPFYLVRVFPSLSVFISCWSKKFKIVQTVRTLS